MAKIELEDRKIKEILHSQKRREILQGFERVTDTHESEQANNLEQLIKNKSEFEYHFSNMKYYSITTASEKYKKDWLRQHCSEKSIILDFACGNGENGLSAASLGAKCIGIDISPEGIQNAKKNAADLGLEGLADFLVMDGENLEFEDSTFDIGIEYGALHHVDLNKALKELARVLKPGSKMLCIEAMRHNPLIHWYRKRTPHLRTEWEVEHILGVESLDQMRKHFHNVNVRFFHLTSLALVPFRKTAIFKWILPFFDLVDRAILSIPAIGKFGWIMIIELSSPRK
jgi:ubiquinone/menaquinone biosynthesis C-methylase UbiE